MAKLAFLAAIILAVVSSSKALVADEAFVVSNGTKFYLDGYTAHHSLAEALDSFISQRFVRSLEFALESSHKKADDLLLSIDSRQYIIVLLIDALSSQDLLYSNILTQTTSAIIKPDEIITTDTLDEILNYPEDKIYIAARFMVENKLKDTLEISKPISDVLLILYRKYAVFKTACLKGDLKIVDWMLENDLYVRKEAFDSLLVAWRNSHWSVVKSIIRLGEISDWSVGRKEATMKNDQGESLLHLAAELGRADLAKLLEEAGADANALDGAGETPVGRAVRGGHGGLVRHFLAGNAKSEGLLTLAAKQGDFQLVRTLVSNGVDINEKDKHGRTSLQIVEEDSIFIFLQHAELHGFNISNVVCGGELYSMGNFVCKLIFKKLKTTLTLNFNEPLNTYLENQIKIINYLSEKGAKPFLYNISKGLFLFAATQVGYEEGAHFLMDIGAPSHVSLKKNIELHPKENYNPTDSCSSFKMDIDIIFKDFNSSIKFDVDLINSLREGWSILHIASSKGVTSVVKRIIKGGSDVNIKTCNGLTPLHVAAFYGHLNIVQILIDYNANISPKSVDGKTPLHMASYNGKLNVVNFLIERKGDIRSSTKDGWSLLHAASSGGHIAMVNFLVSRGLELNAKGKEGRTSLHLAAYFNHSTVVRGLLDLGADLHARTESGWSALHIAAARGQESIVKLLISKGIHVDVSERSSLITPLHIASYLGLSNIVNVLLQRSPLINIRSEMGDAPLHTATRKRHLSVVNLLLRYNADPNVKSKNNQTSLHIACLCGFRDIAESLTANNANVHAKANKGWTSLHMAAYGGYLDIIKFLLDKGMDPNVNSSDSKTPMFSASRNGNIETMELLLDNGANLNATDKFGRHSIHEAAWNGQPKAVEFFLNRGVDPYYQDFDGKTVMYFATFAGRRDVVKLLLNSELVEVDAYTDTKTKTSPLHIAAQYGYYDMAKTLLNMNPNLSAVDEKGDTALHKAVLYSNMDIVILLLNYGANQSLVNHEQKKPFRFFCSSGELMSVYDFIDIINGCTKAPCRDINWKDGVTYFDNHNFIDSMTTA